MSALDSTLRHPCVMELWPHRRVLSFQPSIRRGNRFYCFAKATVDDDEQKHEASRKGFSIRVPTIPKLRDVESARRMLESAFQSLSFEMPRIAIDSAALQGLTFDIFKLSIPKRVLIFDITGFVATKLRKKPPKNLGDAEIVDEDVHPHCAWPRNPKRAGVGEDGVNLELDESMAASTPGMQTMHRSPETDALKLRESPSTASSTHDVSSLRSPMGPHCAWPRKAQALSADCVPRGLRYPHSAWPRRSLSGNGVLVGGQLSVAEASMKFDSGKEEMFPCIEQGGPRCAWPRKTISAKQSGGAECDTDEGLKKGKEADDAGAAELPRRMLATSVGLTIMNQLVKGSIATSLFDFCSLQPGGSLDMADEEDTVLDLGRRTLLVFIKETVG